MLSFGHTRKCHTIFPLRNLMGMSIWPNTNPKYKYKYKYKKAEMLSFGHTAKCCTICQTYNQTTQTS